MCLWKPPAPEEGRSELRGNADSKTGERWSERGMGCTDVWRAGGVGMYLVKELESGCLVKGGIETIVGWDSNCDQQEG